MDRRRNSRLPGFNHDGSVESSPVFYKGFRGKSSGMLP